MSTSSRQQQFRAIFQRIHAQHPACLADEWLTESCRNADGSTARPVVWSRRNGPWGGHDLIFIGAAPGNAGGRGSGNMGAHATRIPFGGDIAGANLDVLLGSIGIDRNDTFIAAAYNLLPDAGGGEPTQAELFAPIGDYPSSIHIVRDTILAAGPRLLVALGNVAIRVILASPMIKTPLRLPSLSSIQRAGLVRNQWSGWPDNFTPDPEFGRVWRNDWNRTLPALLWLTHPSAQNMSPYARSETLFHTRMLDARSALQNAVHDVLGWAIPETRRLPGHTGVYALPEWKDRIGPRHEELSQLWAGKGI